MKAFLKSIKLLGPLGLALLFVGCLVSGTFTVVIFIDNQTLDDNHASGFYHYVVDLSEEDDWDDHKDDIENIDIIGFDIWVRNMRSTATTFDAWVDDLSDAQITNPSLLDADATPILQDLTIGAGPNVVTHITYAESLGHLRNVAALKAYVKSGTFRLYGRSVGTPTIGDDYILDSVRVVVTFTAKGG